MGNVFDDLGLFLTIPLFIWGTGFVVVITSCHKHPTVSLTTLVGCLLLLLCSCIELLACIWPENLIPADFHIGWLVISGLSNGVRYVGYSVLLVAIFGWRSAGEHD